MIHPDARIPNSRNTRRGVEIRSLVLNYLEDRGEEAKTREVAESLTLSLGRVYYHLRRLQGAGCVIRRAVRPALWLVSPTGQRRIDIFLAPGPERD